VACRCLYKRHVDVILLFLTKCLANIHSLSFGFLLFHMPITHRTYRRNVLTPAANLSLGLVDFSTGSSSPTSSLRSDSEQSSNASVQYTQSPLSPTPRGIMFGRTIQEWRERALSWVPCPCEGMKVWTGWPSWTIVKEGEWMISRQTFLFGVTTSCPECVRIMQNLFPWNEKFSCIGVQLEQASLEGPGQKQVWTLTRRILTQNFGVATATIKEWLLMNFAVESEYPTSSDGSTDTQFSLNLRAPQPFWFQQKYGLRQTSTPAIGIPNSTRPLRRRLFVDLT